MEWFRRRKGWDKCYNLFIISIIFKWDYTITYRWYLYQNSQRVGKTYYEPTIFAKLQIYLAYYSTLLEWKWRQVQILQWALEKILYVEIKVFQNIIVYLYCTFKLEHKLPKELLSWHLVLYKGNGINFFNFFKESPQTH